MGVALASSVVARRWTTRRRSKWSVAENDVRLFSKATTGLDGPWALCVGSSSCVRGHVHAVAESAPSLGSAASARARACACYPQGRVAQSSSILRTRDVVHVRLTSCCVRAETEPRELHASPL